MNSIYIQLPYYNKHITPVFEELSKLDSVKLRIGLLRGGTDFRQGYDWDNDIDTDLYAKLWLMDKDSVEQFYQEANVIAVHGFLSYPENYKLIRRGISDNKPIWIFSEGLKPKSLLNRLLKRVAVKLIDSHLVTFFELGDRAFLDYFHLGASKWSHQSFAYSVEPVDALNSYTGSQLRLIFVGQLIDRKRPFDLISLMSEISDLNITMSIVGDGPMRDELERMTTGLELTERIEFLGLKSKAEVNRLLLEHDVLILPSAYDGWGAVINEAMECGCSVICSSGCRGSIIIDPVMVYDTGNISELRERVLQHVDEVRRNHFKDMCKQRVLSFRPEALAEKLIHQL